MPHSRRAAGLPGLTDAGRSSPLCASTGVLFLSALAPPQLHFLLDHCIHNLTGYSLRGTTVDLAQALRVDLRLSVGSRQAVGLLFGVGQLGVAESRESGRCKERVDEFLIMEEQLVRACELAVAEPVL